MYLNKRFKTIITMAKNVIDMIFVDISILQSQPLSVMSNLLEYLLFPLVTNVIFMQMKNNSNKFYVKKQHFT